MLDNYESKEGNQVMGPEEGKQMGNFCYKSKISGGGMRDEKSRAILEQAIPGTTNAIPQVETYNKYGATGRKAEIDSLDGRDVFGGVDISEIPEGGVVIGEICLHRQEQAVGSMLYKHGRVRW